MFIFPLYHKSLLKKKALYSLLELYVRTLTIIASASIFTVGQWESWILDQGRPTLKTLSHFSNEFQFVKLPSSGP